MPLLLVLVRSLTIPLSKHLRNKRRGDTSRTPVYTAPSTNTWMVVTTEERRGVLDEATHRMRHSCCSCVMVVVMLLMVMMMWTVAEIIRIYSG